MSKVLNWVLENKTWLFSGGGCVVILCLLTIFRRLLLVLLRKLAALLRGRKRSAHINIREFGAKFISFKYMKKASRILAKMVHESRFEPNIIIGVDPGGLLAAVIMNSIYRETIPIGYIQLTRSYSQAASHRRIQCISLPQNIRVPHETHATNKENAENEKLRILITDVKFKSGDSARVAMEKLVDLYQNVEIMYAIVLLYVGGRAAGRKSIVKKCKRWPSSLTVYGHDLKICAAYYTDTDPTEEDRISEELRPSIDE